MKPRKPKAPKPTVAIPNNPWHTPPPATPQPAKATIRRHNSLTRERIRQIEETALRKVRSYLIAHKITRDQFDL